MIPTSSSKYAIGTWITSVFLLLSLYTCSMQNVNAFTSVHQRPSRCTLPKAHNTIQSAMKHPMQPKPPLSTSMTMANFLDDIGKFFDGFGNDDSSDENDLDDLDDDDGIYTGSSRIISIPAKTMKIGGLRLYCSLYLMGLQNTPEPKCWKAHQSDNFEVNLRHCDLTGSIIIQFKDEGIDVYRLGSSPSMKYLTHESMILNGFLDELHAIVFEGDVGEENRLLTLQEPNAIEKAREVVSFA